MMLAQPTPPDRPHPWLSWLLAPRGSRDLLGLRHAVGGKTVLITGASFGIGAALAVRLGAAGAKLVLAARSANELHTLAQQIRSAGGIADVVSLDLTDAPKIAAAAQKIESFQGSVDIVVHNAGKSIRRPLAQSLDRAHDFERCMAVNYLGPVALQLGLLQGMFRRRGGQIVNVSSVGVRLPPSPLWAAYIASKSAFDNWLGANAPELRLQGIACTSIYLGLVHTRMSAPTEQYRTMPGQTPDQAAMVICRALIARPRRIGPWWLTPASLLTWPLATPLEWLHTRLLRRPAKVAALKGSDAKQS